MALKTVAEYFESIRDDREVYLDGKKVDDVTTHPIMKNLAEYASADYEMALDPHWQDLLTEVLPNGERVHFTFISPRSKEDLVRRRAVIQLTTRAQGGPGGAKFTGIDGINGVTLACGRIELAGSRQLQRFFHRHRTRGHRRRSVHGGPVHATGAAGSGASPHLPDHRHRGPQRHRTVAKNRPGAGVRLATLAPACGAARTLRRTRTRSLPVTAVSR